MDTIDSICSLLIRSNNLDQFEKEKIINAYQNYGRKEFLEYAKRKKIVPFTANALLQCGLDQEYWKPIFEEYRNRNRNILFYLDKVYSALSCEKVKKMFVSENFGALLSSGNDIGLFSSGDIDNYADPSEKVKIYKAFEKIGCRRQERFSGKYQIAAEFFPSQAEGLPENFYISVDFHPLARLKLPCFVNADDFVDWDKVYRYEGTSIVLPPTDALTYICMLHISLHSYSRAPDIRLYTDLLNTSTLGVDYGKIALWAKNDCTRTRISVAADLSNKMMKTRYPEELICLSERKTRLEKLVFDEKNEDLIYEPKGLKVLQIEIRCNDISDLHGLGDILFPNKDWMRSVYGSSNIVAYIKHFLEVA